MGAANKVPGVSGGIVAFVGGFYEELIYSFQKINLKKSDGTSTLGSRIDNFSIDSDNRFLEKVEPTNHAKP